MPRRRPASPGPAAPAHLQRSSSWAGVGAGEPVRVTGTRIRGATWTFVAHVRNTRSGEEWVEVVGGRAGDRSVRSFRPDQIVPVTSGRGTAPPPLATAPRLPFS